MDAAGEPFLGDFGLIKLLDEDHALTRSQQRVGTPAYMAPEQTGLVPTPVCPQTDIWALGVLLYELLTGARPFTAVQKDETSTLLWKIVNEAPPRPRTVKPGFDPGLEAVILRCLEKNPRDRFGSADQLADELARWQRQEKLHTRRAPVRRFLYHHRWVAAGLMFCAVVFAITAGFWYRTTPEFVLQSLRSELLENGAVVLVPEGGKPRWQALAIDQRVHTYFNEQEGVWMIQTWELGLVELLRDLPLEAYQLRAEIRHEESDPWSGPGHVGLFVGHQANSADPKTPHFCCNLIYNDQIDERPKIRLPGVPIKVHYFLAAFCARVATVSSTTAYVSGPAVLALTLRGLKRRLPTIPDYNVAQLKYRLYADTGIAGPVDELVGWTKAWRFQCAGRIDKRKVPWRVLVMAVYPDQIVCTFDGKVMQPLQRAYADQRFQASLRENQTQYPAKFGPLGNVNELRFSQRGSLGLVVSKGAIAVKNVTVRRIPPKH